MSRWIKDTSLADPPEDCCASLEKPRSVWWHRRHGMHGCQLAKNNETSQKSKRSVVKAGTRYVVWTPGTSILLDDDDPL